MRANSMTSSGCGGTTVVTELAKPCVHDDAREIRLLRESKRQGATEYQRLCRETQPEKMKEYQRRGQTANREKRQELARMRQEANLKKVKEREGRSKASRERLKGKGLFYCESALKRAMEIQRRLDEADRV